MIRAFLHCQAVHSYKIISKKVIDLKLLNKATTSQCFAFGVNCWGDAAFILYRFVYQSFGNQIDNFLKSSFFALQKRLFLLQVYLFLAQ